MKTMKIQEETHSRLSGMGKKGETFSEVIDRLIENRMGLTHDVECGMDIIAEKDARILDPERELDNSQEDISRLEAELSSQEGSAVVEVLCNRLKELRKKYGGVHSHDKIFSELEEAIE